MQSEKKTESDVKILYDFIGAIQSVDSIEEIYKLTSTIFKDSLSYDFALIYMIDSAKTLQIKMQVGIDLQIEESVQIDEKFLTTEFSSQKLKIYLNWRKREDLQKVFKIPETNNSLILAPLISNKHMIGFLCIGREKEESIQMGQEPLLEAIIFSIGYSISSLLIRDELSKHNHELQELAKKMRHDFANDIQSIEMTIELLLTTELSGEQNKYMRILGNAKNSAVKKLLEFRALKDKFEKSVSLTYGIPIE